MLVFMTKRIVLCADDYGQAPEISQGIITLLTNGRLTAASCIVNTDYWPDHAKGVAPFYTQADIGLHINLTEHQPLSERYIQAHGNQFYPVNTLLRKAFLGKLDGAAIESELYAQINRFYEYAGFWPRFVDGHQHVHQFPIIRDALISVYERCLRQQGAYVRLVNTRIRLADWLTDIKKIVIYASGTAALKRLLDKNKIPYNQSFNGIYSFSRSNQYPVLFKRFLEEAGDGGLIMCHPGMFSERSADPLAKTRYEEYQYLMGAQFLTDCRTHGVVLQRFA